MGDKTGNGPATAGWSKAMVKAILMGVGGTVVIFLFLVSFLQVLEAVKFVPWIIFFNAALTGYALIDKTRAQIRRRVPAAAVAGLFCTLCACVVLSMVNLWVMGDIIFTLRDLLLFGVTGICASALGALLAIKFFRLNTS